MQQDIRERALAFSVRGIRVSESLRGGVAYSVLARQLVRSGTSIGANLEEAQAAHSRADFIAKMIIAQKEAREPIYWLKLIVEAELLFEQQLSSLRDEASQIAQILDASVRSVRARHPDNDS